MSHSLLTDAQKWLLFCGLLVLGWLLYLLAPVLSPFLVGALLAYLGDPLADRLEARSLSRTVAVVIVFAIMLLMGFLLLLILLPMLERQIVVLIQKVPLMLHWLEESLLPRVAELTGSEGLSLDDREALKSALTAHWQQLGQVMTNVLKSLTTSGQMMLGWLAYMVLIPVVTFYLLRDWDVLVAKVRDLLPRRYEPAISTLAGECDEVLASFMRGQLSVMLALGVIYTIGLWLIGLELSLLIGMLAGLVSFVPYLGFVVGIVVAGVAALMQFQEVMPLIYVAIVFGIGQALEGMVLSPLLVGDRIGLHPVAVIFSVMAGGQLFGFMGVLLALPVAAVIVVLLRHSRELYLDSNFYTP